MAFSRRDEEEDISNTRWGIKMPKFPEGAPKGSMDQAARFSFKDDNSSDTSAISGTTDDKEQLHFTKKTKKQYLATVQKARDDASRSGHDEFPDVAGKKKREKWANVQKSTTKRKESSKSQRESDLNSGKEGEGLGKVPKVSTCPRCQKAFENKNNV